MTQIQQLMQVMTVMPLTDIGSLESGASAAGIRPPQVPVHQPLNMSDPSTQPSLPMSMGVQPCPPSFGTPPGSPLVNMSPPPPGGHTGTGAIPPWQLPTAFQPGPFWDPSMAFGPTGGMFPGPPFMGCMPPSLSFHPPHPPQPPPHLQAQQVPGCAQPFPGGFMPPRPPQTPTPPGAMPPLSDLPPPPPDQIPPDLPPM